MTALARPAAPALPAGLSCFSCRDDGIVVVRGREGERVVELHDVPVVLRERLGLEATGGLVELLNQARGEWSGEVLNQAVASFERRLVEETSKLRVEMAQGFASLRQEMAAGQAKLREDMASLRGEMAAGQASLRQELAAQRVELLKWAFLFWVGQLGSIAALLAFVLRGD